MTTSSPPETPELARGLAAITEDALFGVAAAGNPDEDVLVGLAKRRSALYEAAVRGESTLSIASLREWTTELCAAAAPVCPPSWMPMSSLIGAGLTLEGGARGMRALFTAKPSAKRVEQVRRLGGFCVRVLVAVLAADGDLDTEEQDLRAILVASLGLLPPDQHRLLFEPPFQLDELEIPDELEPKQARDVVEGAWIAAAGDGIDPREERVIAALGAKLGIRPEDMEAARAVARQFVEDQRDLGGAVIDAIRYLLVDEPEEATTLGKVAARLFVPHRYRLEPLSALHQRSTITLANRWHLNRASQSAVLAASWLAALHSDPKISRRITLILRHEDIARDLRADGNGAFVRERLDHIVETQLQLAAIAVGS